MSFRASAQLPGELIDRIIRYILPDRRAVGLCAFIGRAWLPWTRLHLFSYVQLVAYKKHVVPFLILLQSPYCTFPPHVRCLRIDWQQDDLRVEHHAILLNVVAGQAPMVRPQE
jgi:hypothetical protein